MINFRNQKNEIVSGIKGSFAFLLIMIPISFSYVLLADKQGLAPSEIVLYSALMFAGTVQIAVLHSLSQGAGIFDVLIVTFMASLRLGFVGLSMFVYFNKQLNKRVIPLLSFFWVDPAVGVIPPKANEKGNLLTFSLAFLISFWVQWVLLSVMFVYFGFIIPKGWLQELSFAVPSIFIGLTFMMIKNNIKEGLIIVIIAAPLSLLLTYGTTVQLSSILAAVIAAVLGTLIQDKGSDYSG